MTMFRNFSLILLILMTLRVASANPTYNKDSKRDSRRVGQIAMGTRDIGNGGIGLVCFHHRQRNRPISVDLFDFFEWRHQLKGINLDISTSNTDYIDILREVLNRLERVDPERAQRYWHQALDFWKNSKEVSTLLEFTGDLGGGARVYKLCPTGKKAKAYVIVNQIPKTQYPPIGMEYEYMVSMPLWEQLNELEKAGLILHELLYEDAIALGQLNSEKTRYLNFLIFSDFLSDKSRHEYMGLLSRLGFIKTEGDLVSVPHPKKEGEVIYLDRRHDGRMKTLYSFDLEIFGQQYTVLPGGEFLYRMSSHTENRNDQLLEVKARIKNPPSIKICDKYIKLAPQSEVSFHSNVDGDYKVVAGQLGERKTVRCSPAEKLSLYEHERVTHLMKNRGGSSASASLKVTNTFRKMTVLDQKIQVSEFYINSSGVIIEAKRVSQMTFPLGSFRLSVQEGGRIGFRPDGSLACFEIPKNIQVNIEGYSYTLLKESPIYVNRLGELGAQTTYRSRLTGKDRELFAVFSLSGEYKFGFRNHGNLKNYFKLDNLQSELSVRLQKGD